ncbi:MAG: ATP phosphoribosyltransferase regulatory subunit [Clostridia bacterium]|nr:ATP phosphoribosyltransferase regulatory subunit [Clostridia bacterium]
MEHLNAEERASVALRALYLSYGYRPYQVSKFEEYDLYMRNKSLLEGEQILTFSGADGRLMALKPDITFSVVRNTSDDDGQIKLFYAETVYRAARGAYGFREIMQTGVECIGMVDAYAMAEVLTMAAQSLQTISPAYVLDIADMGVASGILEGEAVSDAQRGALMALVSAKNLHGLAALCAQLGVSAEAQRCLSALITEFGPLGETLDRFERLGLPAACTAPLRSLHEVAQLLEAEGVANVNLDFSVVNDMRYYNGLVFSGFIEGIPSGVLSGGRYDLLMRRMGRSSEAIGFAVCLDQLERFMHEKPEYDVDVLILYDGDGQAAKAAELARAYRGQGGRVRVQRSGDTAIRAAKTIVIGNEG